MKAFYVVCVLKINLAIFKKINKIYLLGMHGGIIIKGAWYLIKYIDKDENAEEMLFCKSLKIYYYYCTTTITGIFNQLKITLV